MMVLINLCVQLGVFDAFSPGETASAAEIAAKVDVDVSIISTYASPFHRHLPVHIRELTWIPARFLRALLLEGLFAPASSSTGAPSSAETAGQPTRYAHTAASLALHGPDGNDLWRASIALPIDRYWKNGFDYFRTHTLAETQDPLRSAFAWSTGHEGLGFFAALEQDKVYAPIWKRAMALLAKYQLAVVGEGMFPWHTLREEVEAEGGKRPLLVDVGGGKGGASVAIREACGGDGFGAEVVLEDLPIVLEAEGEEVRIEGVRNLIYDFFAGGEQPVKSECPSSLVPSRQILTVPAQMPMSTTSARCCTTTTTTNARLSCGRWSRPWRQRRASSSASTLCPKARISGERCFRICSTFCSSWWAGWRGPRRSGGSCSAASGSRWSTSGGSRTRPFRPTLRHGCGRPRRGISIGMK